MPHHPTAAHRRLLCALAALLPNAALAAPPAPLRLSWDQPNHESGIYYVKDEATLTVLVDNPAPNAAELSGDILFGTHTGPPGAGDFKILSVTPIAAAQVGAGRRANIPLKVTFGAAGTYELRWRSGGAITAIPGAARDPGLEAIFAPRTALAPGIAEEPPWVALLPPAAVRHPGYLSDYVAQTSVRRFVIDERFSFDPAKNVGLGFGASTGAGVREIDACLAEAAKIKAGIILRVVVGTGGGNGGEMSSISAFRAYIEDAIKRAQGAVIALVIVPATDSGTVSDAQKSTFVAYYLAGYAAAKKADKKVALLGAGSAGLTAQWLADAQLTAYVDGLALADAAGEPVVAKQYLDKKKLPLYVLPPMPGKAWAPAAAGMAAGAAWVGVPGPEADHGVAAHLLGGSVFIQRLQVTVPTADRNAPDTTALPFVAVFQGDGYAVAAVAGFSAGTDIDALYPSLARTRTEVTPVKSDDTVTYANLLVADDAKALRVVDAAGAPVDCRWGDNVYVPAADSVMYVLQGGTAEDLAGLLRVASCNRLPVCELGAAAGAEGITIKIHNISPRELAGTVRIIRPPANAGEGVEVLAGKEFMAVAVDKTLALTLPVSAEILAKISGPVVVEVTTGGPKAVVQRTAVELKVR